ncbi:hypothetical protein ACC735_02455 [Rhizobium ruizarguesonis]
MSKKAVGQRGSWFATVDGKELPCVHKHWLKWPHYHDPFKPVENGPNLTKIQEYVEAIQHEKKVILTNDTVHRDPQGMVSGFTRQSYVAMFAVDDVTFDPGTGLKFRIISRLSDLQ